MSLKQVYAELFAVNNKLRTIPANTPEFSRLRAEQNELIDKKINLLSSLKNGK